MIIWPMQWMRQVRLGFSNFGGTYFLKIQKKGNNIIFKNNINSFIGTFLFFLPLKNIF